MSLKQELSKSTRSMERAIAQHKAPKAKTRAALFGLGWITLVLGIIREFCRLWPDIKAELGKVIAYLKEHGQQKAADILTTIVTFFDTVAKVCPWIPKP